MCSVNSFVWMIPWAARAGSAGIPTQLIWPKRGKPVGEERKA